MKKIKVSEASGAALDWLEAKCQVIEVSVTKMAYNRVLLTKKKSCDLGGGEEMWSPSTDWSQGGPIIDREKITVCWQGATWVGSTFNVRVSDEYEFHKTGPTPLIAAMRCYVASKLGDEVEVPDELN